MKQTIQSSETKTVIKIVKKEVTSTEHVTNTFFKSALMTPEEKDHITANSKIPANIVHLIEEKNKNIIDISANSYTSINQDLDNLGKIIFKIEDKVQRFTRKTSQEISIKNNNSKLKDDEKSIEQIDHEILELENKIKENKAIIEGLKVPKEKCTKSIPQDDEFMSKFSLEKKAIIDTINEDDIQDLTYLDEFPKNHHYGIMEIILEEIGKFKFKTKAEKNFEAEKVDGIPFSDDLKTREIEKKKKELIFQDFKVNCFDAWKFKNLFLALESLNLIEKSDIEEFKIKLEALRVEGVKSKKLSNGEIKYEDPHWEPLFEKFYKVLKVLLFLTVGQKKIEATKLKLVNLNQQEKNATSLIAECTGKISMLVQIKNKLVLHADGKQPKNVPVVEENTEPIDEDQKEILKYLRELKNLKNSLQTNYNSYLNQIGSNLFNPKNSI